MKIKKLNNLKKRKSRLARFLKNSPFHGINLKLQRDKSFSRKPRFKKFFPPATVSDEATGPSLSQSGPL
jgi:hypothetical protein